MYNEAYFFAVPGGKLRPKIKWMETVEIIQNMVVQHKKSPKTNSILQIKTPLEHPRIYGDGSLVKMVTRIILNGG